MPTSPACIAGTTRANGWGPSARGGPPTVSSTAIRVVRDRRVVAASEADRATAWLLEDDAATAAVAAAIQSDEDLIRGGGGADPERRGFVGAVGAAAHRASRAVFTRAGDVDGRIRFASGAPPQED